MSQKKKKSTSLTYSPESVREVKKKLKALNKKRVLTIFLSTVAVFSVYEAILGYEESIGCTFSIATLVMTVFVTVLSATVILLNHGFSKNDFTPDMLRSDIPVDEAKEICKKLNSQRATAKKIMMILLPFMFSLLFDIVVLFYGDTFKNILGFLSPS